MNATKKKFGFRLNEKIENWTDRFGRKGGKIVKLIHLKYCQKVQVVISNGDILTSEIIHQDEMKKRGLLNAL